MPAGNTFMCPLRDIYGLISSTARTEGCVTHKMEPLKKASNWDFKCDLCSLSAKVPLFSHVHLRAAQSDMTMKQRFQRTVKKLLFERKLLDFVCGYNLHQKWKPLEIPSAIYVLCV